MKGLNMKIKLRRKSLSGPLLLVGKELVLILYLWEMHLFCGMKVFSLSSLLTILHSFTLIYVHLTSFSEGSWHTSKTGLQRIKESWLRQNKGRRNKMLTEKMLEDKICTRRAWTIAACGPGLNSELPSGHGNEGKTHIHGSQDEQETTLPQ